MKFLVKRTFILFISFFIFLMGFSLRLVIAQEEKYEDHYIKEGQSIYFAGTIEEGPLIQTSYVDIKDAQVETTDHLAQTGHDKYYTDELIPLSDCVYTFDKMSGTLDENANHSTAYYVIKAANKDENIYLDPNTGYNTRFNSSIGNQIKVECVKTVNGNRFAFSRNNCFIFFEKLTYGNNPYCFQRWGRYQDVTTAEVSLLFDLYELNIEKVDDQEYHRYTRATSITDGGQYIIAATVRDVGATDDDEHFTYRYVLNPSLDFSNAYTQLVKWVDGFNQQIVTGHKITANTITNQIENNAAVFTIDGITHRIHVIKAPSSEDLKENSNILSKTGSAEGFEIDKVSISLGTSYKLGPSDGYEVNYWVSKDDDIVSVDKNGVITAVGIPDGGSFAKTYVSYLDTNNEFHTIEVVVINQNQSANKKLVDIFLIKDDNHSDIRSAAISDVWVDTNNPLKATYNKEVYYYEFDVKEKAGLVFFDKPSFGSIGDYSTGTLIETEEQIEKASWFVVGDDDIKIGSNSDSLSNATHNNISDLAIFKNVANVNAVLSKAEGYEYRAFVTGALDSELPQDDARRTLKATIRMGSSPRIQVLSDSNGIHQIDKNSVYKLVKNEKESSLNDLTNESFGVTREEFSKAKLIDLSVYKDETKLERVTTKPLEVSIDVSGININGLDKSKVKYNVFSIHDEEIISWGKYEASDNTISLMIDKFSPFLIVPTDEYYHATVSWSISDAIFNLKDEYRWNTTKLCYERVEGKSKIESTTPSRVEITITSTSTRPINYDIELKKVSDIKINVELKNTSASEKGVIEKGNIKEQSVLYSAIVTPYTIDNILPEEYLNSENIVFGEYVVKLTK